MKRIAGLMVCLALSLTVDVAPLAKSLAPAPEIVLRHALSGPAEAALANLVRRFNDEQKGRAKVLLQALKDVADPRQLPQMAFLDSDDSDSFFRGRPRFKPLYKVMAESGERLDEKSFLPLIADAVDDDKGRLQALPLGMAMPALLWNKEAFIKSGLDPEKAPGTWLDVQKAAASLFDAGYKCPLTSSRFSWVHLENISTQHGEPISVREGHGVVKVVLNRMIEVKHIALLSSWYKSFYFHYFGPGDEADGKFLSGECAMLTGASSLYAVAAHGRFPVGMAKLPYYDDFYGATPEKILPDGAALWVLDGQRKDEYRVAARFAKFMMRPDAQKEWLQATGYLPMTTAALITLKADQAGLGDAYFRRLSARKSETTRERHGFGLGRLRDILNEEMATVWKNTQPAKAALDTAMLRANGMLPRLGLPSR